MLCSVALVLAFELLFCNGYCNYNKIIENFRVFRCFLLHYFCVYREHKGGCRRDLNLGL